MNNQVEIFQGQDGITEIEVKFKGDTIWLNQNNWQNYLIKILIL